jgi:hypothetical protein
MVALQVHDGLEEWVLACQAMADQLHDAKGLGAAIDVVAQRDQPRRPAVGVIAAQIQQAPKLAVAPVNVTDHIGTHHGELFGRSQASLPTGAIPLPRLLHRVAIAHSKKERLRVLTCMLRSSSYLASRRAAIERDGRQGNSRFVLLYTIGVFLPPGRQESSYRESIPRRWTPQLGGKAAVLWRPL